jgi:hypothetical protein
MTLAPPVSVILSRFTQTISFAPFKLFFLLQKKQAFWKVFSKSIAHAFDRFWVIFTPFKLFSIIYAEAKNGILGHF